MYKISIKEFRLSKNYTQEILALKVGISQNYLSELEQGKFDTHLTILFKIAEALDICPCLLIDGIEFNCLNCCRQIKNNLGI